MNHDPLINLIRTQSSPMEPRPTGTEILIEPAGEIRAVVFDIYGTLFISGSGDISLALKEDRSPAIVESLSAAGFIVMEPDVPWSDAFMSALEAARRERQKQGIHFPEVRIEEVWESFIAAAVEKKWLQGDGAIEQAIVEHECRVNPCWPMPHLDETLRSIKSWNIAMGIVSNAQFYTPLLFPALLQGNLGQYGFDDSISVWSYREREGKPSRHLYRKLKDALAQQGILPSATLYVGNDVRNDIWPAQLEGFRTVLFAGDQRSLRRREDDPDCRKVRPEFIITDLAQLLDINAE